MLRVVYDLHEFRYLAGEFASDLAWRRFLCCFTLRGSCTGVVAHSYAVRCQEMEATQPAMCTLARFIAQNLPRKWGLTASSRRNCRRRTRRSLVNYT